MEVDSEKGLESPPGKQPQSDDSDVENEMNFPNKNKSRSHFRIIDSDSETELNEKPGGEESGIFKLINNGPENDDDQATRNISAENKDNKPSNENTDSDITLNNKPKRLANIVDSDSDEGEDEGEDLFKSPVPHNKSFNDDLQPQSTVAVVYNMNKRGELVPEDTDNSEETRHQKSRLSELVDSESSEDETATVGLNKSRSNSENYEKSTEPKRRSKKPPKEKAPKPMTGKEAVKMRKEIQSESQRMLRESRVSLPYHTPKSHTLPEFLEKRSKLASALPTLPKGSPSMSIKMSKDQLVIMSKKLDERSKEVEEFYKSESEEESESEEKDPEDISFDIRGWLDALADNAVDKVENSKLVPDLPTYTSEDQNVMEIEIDPSTSGLPPPITGRYALMENELNYNDLEEKGDKIDPPKKLNIFDLLKVKLGNTQPRLSGGPDDVIDLNEGVTKPNERKKFVEKFMQNAFSKPQAKHKVHLNVVSLTQGEIQKETLTMNVDDEEDKIAGALHEIPGAKMQKLRVELQNQMALRRSEMWEKRKNDVICPEKEGYCENADGYQSDPDFLDDEEEEIAEMTETSEEEDEEDEIVDDSNRKPKTKSAFVDDEAEVSGNDEYDADDDDDEDIDNDEQKSNDIDNELKPKNERKVLKRIIRGFSEDDSDEDNEAENQEKIPNSNPQGEEHLDSTVSFGEDDMLPPNLPRENVTPQRNTSDVDFLSPVTYLTGLQSLNSGSKFLKDSPVLSPFRIPTDPSPPDNNDCQSKIQKKLFQDGRLDSTQTQSFDDLSMLCSGVFPTTQEYNENKKPEAGKINVTPTTQELVDVCSGFFSGIEKSSNDDSNPSVSLKSPDVIVPLRSSNNKSGDEIKNLDDEQDQLISQLLNEDELEQFKKKFESPVVVNSTSTLKMPTTPCVHNENASEVNATGVIMSDDDDGDDGLELGRKLKKKKKLTFSDDEDSDCESNKSEEETIDLHDDVSECSDENDDAKNPNDVAYDSEENEIDPSAVKKFNIGNFVENEAELSESEWGSEDEDEKGLDKMDLELGDEEVFDENQVRSDLEKIHRRKLLDDDTREVKLLQELLLKDGEMHGSGRQRQFKWRNIDNADFGEDEAKNDEDDVYLDEEESEEQFRKMRHKREMFLQQKVDKDDVESILSDSQILKIGQKIVQKSLSLPSQASTSTIPNEPQDSFKVKQPFNILNKRGSFLSRNDQVLERLAEYTKVTTVDLTAKNKRSFIFKSVSSTLETTIVRDNKRKAVDGTPIALKKLRLADMSPVVVKKNSETKPGSAKSLFPDW